MSLKLQFKVRLDELLHGKIKSAADKNNQSVNAEIVSRLEKSVNDEEKLDDKAKANDLAELQKKQLNHVTSMFNSLTRQLNDALKRSDNLHEHLIPAICPSKLIRLHSTGTTYGDKDQVIAFIRTFTKTKRVLLSVRDGYANHSALTITIFSGEYVFTADQSPMTVERQPREEEVLELFKELELRGLLDVAEFAISRTRKTFELPVDEALAEQEKHETKPIRKNIYEFLSLFFREPEKVKPDWFVDEWKKLN